VQALKLIIKGTTFPRELLNFPNLTELHLEGECIEWPDEILPWKELRTLSMKWPSLQGSITSVLKLPKLENLKVIDTPLKIFLLPLGNIPAPLKSLTLKSCGLSELPEEISLLSKLAELNLTGNILQVLPAGFLNLRDLKRLNLDHNHFKRFPDIVKKMPALTHLSIDRNPFPEEEKERIQREFHIWVE
jgi:Leucine-rich repeat (LRR) protein